jgi:hypothetical protein
MDQSSEVTVIVDNLVGPMHAVIYERMDENCHPTTSGNSHLSGWVFLGYRRLTEIENAMNRGSLLSDFGSVPGSQSNPQLTLLSSQFTARCSRRQLTPRLPLRIPTPDPGSI